MTRFAVLEADPPWKFGDSLPGRGRGASSHYGCLTVAELKAIELPPLADDAVLLLWRVAAMQEEALEIVRAWGFEPKSEIVWEKTTKTGKPHFGMGRSVRASHEVCILATRGRWAPKSRSIRSRFEAAVGRHSEKPEAFYALVEELAEGPYARLFARAERPGWTSFGDELEKPLTIGSTYPQTKKFPTDELILEERCQARADVDHEAVHEYRDAYAAGTELPDPKLFMVSGKAYVVDGYHRVPAAILAKKRWLRCEVVGEGTLDDAVWYAAAVNQTHGVRRTNADKRRAVRLALETPIGQEQSSRVIAEHVGVSNHFVEKIRVEYEAEQKAQLGSDPSSHGVEPDSEEPVRRIGKDGKRRPAKAQRTVVEPEPDAGHPPDEVPAIECEDFDLSDVPALADLDEDELAHALEADAALASTPPCPAPTPPYATDSESVHKSEAGTQTATAMPEVAERLLEVAKEIKRVRALARKVLGEELNAYAQRTEETLRGAEYHLRYAVPEVCPKCGGEGCKRCTGRGWVDRSTAEQMRASAKAAA